MDAITKADSPTCSLSPTEIATSISSERGSSSEVDFSKLQAKPYMPMIHCPTEFFSISPISDLYSLLAECFHKMGEVDFDPSFLAITVTLPNKPTKLQVRAEILQGEEKTCVRFLKQNGDYIQFGEFFNKAKQFFGGHVNARRL